MRQITDPKELVVGEQYIVWNHGEASIKKIPSVKYADGYARACVRLYDAMYGPIPKPNKEHETEEMK